jgi:hypothetical protein
MIPAKSLFGSGNAPRHGRVGAFDTGHLGRMRFS